MSIPPRHIAGGSYDRIRFLIHAAQAYILGGGKTDKIQFDLARKSIQSGNLYIVRDGRLALRKVFLGDGAICEIYELIAFDGDPYAEIERLYAQFKHSVPNRPAEKRQLQSALQRRSDHTGAGGKHVSLNRRGVRWRASTSARWTGTSLSATASCAASWPPARISLSAI